jgi:hypothetical protein
MSYDKCVLRVILIALMLAAVDFAAQTVDGHVVNSVTSIDIPGVAVNLVRAGQVAYSATTNSEGHFRIEAVEAGIYTANYTARGFSPIPNFGSYPKSVISVREGAATSRSSDRSPQ